MCLKVCPLHGDRKKWQDFTSWRLNACISIPTLRCFACGTHNLDGSVYCYRCGTRAEPNSDLSAALAPERDRHLATLTDQPSSFISLQPRSDTNRNRDQQARSDRSKSRGAAVVKNQATKVGIALEDTLTENPLTAKNHARVHLHLPHGMVAKIANMKIANAGRTRTMIEGGQGYEIDGKICYSVPGNALRINEKEVYVAFMDRFYTAPETAIIALAACRSGASAFRVLGFVNRAIDLGAQL